MTHHTLTKLRAMRHRQTERFNTTTTQNALIDMTKKADESNRSTVGNNCTHTHKHFREYARIDRITEVKYVI